LFSSLSGGIGAIENGHFVLGDIDIIDQISQTFFGNGLSDFIVLFILIIKKIIS
jgi:hypothetical protein